MKKFFRRDKFETQQPLRYFFSPPFVRNIVQWLMAFIRLTKEDQENAGIYLGGEGRD